MSESNRRAGTPWAFAALALALGCLFTWFTLNRQVALPENRTLFVIGFLLAAGLAIFAVVRGASWPGRIAAVPAVLIGLFLPYTIAISEQSVTDEAIRVGDPMPRFASIDDQGQAFDSETLRGHPVLIKFFRAHW